jgi:hypothetical protein
LIRRHVSTEMTTTQCFETNSTSQKHYFQEQHREVHTRRTTRSIMIDEFLLFAALLTYIGFIDRFYTRSQWCLARLPRLCL